LTSKSLVPAASSSMLSAAANRFVKGELPAAKARVEGQVRYLRISGGFMLRTFVMRPCMIKKCGLLTFSCTEWKRFCARRSSVTSRRTTAARAGASNLHLARLGRAAVDEILVFPADHDLAGDGELVVLLVPQRAIRGVLIVENQSDGSLLHARLALLVHQLL
jgi:hypothetical protein